MSEQPFDLQAWLAEQRAHSTMSVTDSTLEGLTPWGMQTADGRQFYGREDGKFFRLEGVTVQTGAREVKGWTQPLLAETEMPGIVVLVANKERSQFLVSAREEPGNPPDKNYILLGAPLQASIANLEQSHGGKLPPHAELYNDQNDYDIVWEFQSQDGGRYRNKVNKIGIVTTNPTFVVPNPNDVVVSRQQLQQALANGDCNSHLAEALGHAMMTIT